MTDGAAALVGQLAPASFHWSSQEAASSSSPDPAAMDVPEDAVDDAHMGEAAVPVLLLSGSVLRSNGKASCPGSEPQQPASASSAPMRATTSHSTKATFASSDTATLTGPHHELRQIVVGARAALPFVKVTQEGRT